MNQTSDDNITPSKKERNTIVKDQDKSDFLATKTEILIWIAIGSVYIIKTIGLLLVGVLQSGPEFIIPVVLSNFTDVLIGVILIAFPFIFKNIFQEFPISLVRKNAAAKSASIMTPGPGVDTARAKDGLGNAEADGNSAGPQSTNNFITAYNPRQLMAFYAARSNQVSAKIFTRAGVYLFVGTMISFSGLIFFYSSTQNIVATENYVAGIFTFLPRFGILFFVEFIALFFLRQYRSAMDEFRYFDGIARTREENLVILRMFDEFKTIVPTVEVLKSMNIYSTPAKFATGETSDIIEMRKLQRDELSFIEGIVAGFKKGKDEKKSERK